MKTTNATTESKKRVAIVSTYKWDDPMTDMNCAWYTHYTYIDVETGQVGEVSACTGCGRGLTDEVDCEVVPMTDEVKALYQESVKRMAEARAKADYERFAKEVDEYNATLRVQAKGQVVEITDGKHKGKVGRVTWIGKSKFGNRSPRHSTWRQAAVFAMCSDRPFSIPCKDDNLVLVRPLSGSWADGNEKVYVDIDKCKVIEGFMPLTLDMDKVRAYNKRSDSNWTAYRGAYDGRSYV